MQKKIFIDTLFKLRNQKELKQLINKQGANNVIANFKRLRGKDYINAFLLVIRLMKKPKRLLIKSK